MLLLPNDTMNGSGHVESHCPNLIEVDQVDRYVVHTRCCIPRSCRVWHSDLKQTIGKGSLKNLSRLIPGYSVTQTGICQNWHKCCFSGIATHIAIYQRLDTTAIHSGEHLFVALLEGPILEIDRNRTVYYGFLWNVV